MTDQVAAPAEAEVVQPSTEAPEGATEGTGASDQAAEQEQRRASDAGRELASRTQRNQQAAAFRRQFADMQRQNAELQRALIERTQPTRPAPADDAPRREQFQSYEDYVEARAEHRAAKKAEETFSKQWQQFGEQVQRAQRVQEEQAVSAQFGGRMQEYARANPEFLDAMQNADFEVPIPACEAISRMDEGPEIMLAMHRDPRIAQALHQLDPVRQVAFLGQLAAHLKFRPSQTSKAPPPGSPVGSRGGPEGSPKSIDDYYATITKHFPGRGKR